MRKVTHNRKTRKKKTRRYQWRGGSIEPELVEPVQNIVQNAFPENQVRVQYERSRWNENHTIGIFVYCWNEDPSNEDTVPSIQMTIQRRDEIELFVNVLTKCNAHDGTKEISGTDVLKRIIVIGKKLVSYGIQQIRLTDASTMSFEKIQKGKRRCSISLSTYKILTSKKHESWYNSHGFISKQYDREVEHNTAMAEGPMAALLAALGASRILERKRSPANWTIYATKKGTQDAIDEFDRTYNDYGITSNMSIKDAIIAIHALTRDHVLCNKNNGADPTITMYIELMQVAEDYLLLYDDHLVYSLG